MLILGLLGMYFDAAVVFVTSQTLFQDWLWPYCEGSPFKYSYPKGGPPNIFRTTTKWKMQ